MITAPQPTIPSDRNVSTVGPTMSSVDLVEVINEERKADAEATGTRFISLRHADFMVKLEKHPGIDSTKFFGQYKDGTGRSLKCYHLPKREAELMVMSESLKVQAKVYDRLVQLEGATVADPLATLPPEQRVLVSLMVEQAVLKNNQAQLAHAQAAQQESIARIEAKQSAIENGASFFTVIAYGAYRGIKFDLKEASALGRKAAALSKANKIAVDKVRDPRFGVVGCYHESMLDQALAALHGGM